MEEFGVTKNCACIRQQLTPLCEYLKLRSGFQLKSDSQWLTKCAALRVRSARILVRLGASAAIQHISRAS